ncbi:hypothetical protein ABT173_10655 [Streptomyces sp. NPDC001795]|uniref:hypothetical protein n=1 Tax=unclassified Streptomyces TaxID=2593676 RepID=UPI003329AA06
MRQHRNGVRFLAAFVLAALAAGCASGTGAGSVAPSGSPVSSSAQPSSASSSSAASSAASGSSVSGSAAPGRTVTASVPPGTSTTTSAGGTGLCLSGTVSVFYPASDNPLRSTCVHVGTRIQVTLRPPDNYRWAPVTSSTPSVVPVLGNQVAPDGTCSATARADSPGTATLTSADTYTPDPHGPPSRPWQLTLTVVP